MIPAVDPGAVYQNLQPELDAAFRRVMRSGRYVLGAEVEEFEERFAEYCGAKACIGVGNGLDALELILRAHDIGSGDEVIVPANTFIATWLSVTRAGATPVPIEVDEETFNLRAEFIENLVTDKTRAVIAVHLYGHPADMDAINTQAQHHGLLVFEDAAQAHGARYKGRRTGSLAQAAAFSFYPVKNLGAFGDGGAVVTDDAGITERIRMLRNYGAHRKYMHQLQGLNSRLDELQAALLSVMLPHLDDWNSKRAAIAARYREGLTGLDSAKLPVAPDWAEPVWHQFVLRHNNRDDLSAQLLKMGIQTLIHYPVPPHRSQAYANENIPARMPLRVTEHLSETILSLPIGPYMKNDDVETVIAAIRRLCH